MNAFRFRAERLLEWRRAQADVARLAVVRAAASVREAAARLEDAEAECARAAREFGRTVQQPVDIATIERHRIWIDQRQEHVLARRRSHDERREAAEAAGAALQDASRHVKVLERLRERAVRRHAEAERQAGARQLDELATSRFARRHAEKGVNRGDRSSPVVQ